MGPHRLFAAGVVGVGTATVLRRAGARATDAPRVMLAGLHWHAFLQANLMRPPAVHVVDVAEPGVPSEAEIRQRNVRGLTAEERTNVPAAANGELEQVDAFPAHSELDHAVQLAQ